MTASAPRVRSRRFSLSQRIRYDYSQPVTNLSQRLKIVPPPAHGGQLRAHWHLSVGGVGHASQRTSLDEFGNVTIDIEVLQVETSVEFALEVEVDIDIEDSGSPFDTPIDNRYLQHTRLTPPGERTVELADGVGLTDLASLCAKVHRSIRYGWGFTGIDSTASEALASGRGVCQDYAHIMLAACRSAGIPARYVSGHLIGEGGSHAWVEVLRPCRGGWLAEGWDPTNNRRTSADYMVVAVGRDYTDASPLSGTYVRAGTNTLSVEKRLELA